MSVPIEQRDCWAYAVTVLPSSGSNSVCRSNRVQATANGWPALPCQRFTYGLTTARALARDFDKHDCTPSESVH
jgi:hypothetical protein